MATANQRAERSESGTFFSTSAPALARAADQAPTMREAYQPPTHANGGWQLPTSPFPMWLFDPASGAILAANDAAGGVYGYTREEFLRCNVRDLFRSIASVSHPAATAGEKVSPWAGTCTQLRKGGEAFDADVAILQTEHAGRSATMVLANPVPRQIENEPEARSKTLLGRPKTIARLLEPASGKQDREHLNRLKDAVSRGLEVAADLRLLSADSGACVSVDPQELIRGARESLRERADEKNVDIVVHCTCRRVWVQPRAFAKALYELLDNAIRATKKGYPVILDVRDTGEGDVLWQVQDSGDGISERVLAKLGQPHQTAWDGASGFGVALAWAVVENHGGLLRFESSLGVGTTATIWLPGAR